MTLREEKLMFKTLNSLLRDVSELKEMLNPHIPKQDKFLSTEQAMGELGIKKTKFREMLANGELPFATKVGYRWKFSRNGIMAYLAKTN